MTNYPTEALVVGVLATFLLTTLAAALLARLGFPLPPARKRTGCIDGLRGYLALSVFAHHFVIYIQLSRLNIGWTHPPVRFFDALGTGAVSLFFMITGLLFYPRVLAGFSACAWPAIYIARLFRIAPLIIISVAIVTVVIILRTGVGFDSRYPVAAAIWISTWDEPPLLGYVESGRVNAYVLWSLWYEWLFYFFALPACALAMDLIRGRLPSYTVPAILLFIFLFARTLFPRSFLDVLPLFAIGMLAYEVTKREFIARRLRKPVAAVVAVVIMLFGMVTFSSPHTWAMATYGFFFVCVACGNNFFGILRTKASLALGECSYSIYLLHGILLSVLFVDALALTRSLPVSLLPITLLPFAALVIMLITPLSFLFLERPAIRIGGWIARRWTSPRPRTLTPKLSATP